MSASATTEELRDTVRGLAADVTRRQQDAESLSRRIAEREGELAGGDGTAAEAAAVAPAAIAGLAGQVAPLVDQLTRDRGELEAAEREIEALLELEAKLAAAGESADESFVSFALGLRFMGLDSRALTTRSTFFLIFFFFFFSFFLFNFFQHSKHTSRPTSFHSVTRSWKSTAPTTPRRLPTQ
jgi:preprotein translocase subunit SecG